MVRTMGRPVRSPVTIPTMLSGLQTIQKQIFYELLLHVELYRVYIHSFTLRNINYAKELKIIERA